MPLSMAFFAAIAPIFLAPSTLADNLFASVLLTVEAAASVNPASSSINWTWMFSLLKQTAIRGRSLVPTTFLRMRQRRNCSSFCFFSVLISMRHGFGRGKNLIVIGLFCLLYAGHVHQRNGRPCLYTVPAGRSCGFPKRLCQRSSYPDLQSSISCFPRPSL